VAIDDLPLDKQAMGQIQSVNRAKSIYRLFLWFFLPLLLWTLIDRIWVGSKFYQRHQLHKTMNN